MNTKRTPTRRLYENEMQQEIPPQAQEVLQVPEDALCDQVHIVAGADDDPELSNRDIREAFFDLARAVTIQLNLSMVPKEKFID